MSSAVFMCLALLVPVCASFAAGENKPSLKEAAGEKFQIGFGTELPSPARAALVRQHANSLTTENSLKFRMLRPTPTEWRWEKADALVDFATTNRLGIVGHNLVWCYQMPKWITDQIAAAQLDKAAALKLQDDHIRTLVGRYRGRIQTWDVVNEALTDSDGYLRDDPWSTLCGEDYIVEAFRSARRADPDAKLLYNDYNLDFPEKRARLFRLLARLEAEGVRVDGVGIQGHMQLSRLRLAELEAAILEIHAAGYPVHITELDVDVYSRGEGADIQRIESGGDPGYAELPDELQARLAEHYAQIFRLLVKHADKIERVTFWNVDDGGSWLNHWPVKGRRNHPLLFDREQLPKPAFYSVMKELTGEKSPVATPSNP